MDYNNWPSPQLYLLRQGEVSLVKTCEEGLAVCRRALRASRWMTRFWMVYGLLCAVAVGATFGGGYIPFVYLACASFGGWNIWLEKTERQPHWRERVGYWEAALTEHRADLAEIDLALMEKDYDGEVT